MGDDYLDAQLKEMFANVQEVELSEIDSEDRELFSAMEELDTHRKCLHCPVSK